MIKRSFIYGTTNRDKLAEVQALAERFGWLVRGMSSVDRALHGEPPTVVEDSPCYEVNAVRKASAYASWAGEPCFADDTGIELDELGGYPGVYTARVGVRGLGSKLSCGRPYRAHFVCCVAYAEPRGRTVAVTARLSGSFVPNLDGRIPVTDLEFSPFFVPDGESLSLHQLLAQGYSDSHRARALGSLLYVLSDP
jgi:XTP/dITP diphosphohydrolase